MNHYYSRIKSISMTDTIFSVKLISSVPFYIVVLLLSFSSNWKAQENNEILVNTGNRNLTVNEYLYRYEFTPHPQSLDQKSFDAKMDFLLTLIAEKILAAEAIEKGYENTDEFLRIMKYLKGIYLRDALYKKEIKDKIEIPNELMIKSLDRAKKKIKMKFIYSDKKEEIDSIFSLILQGNDFDSILSKREEFKEQINIKEVSFGDTHILIEDQIFTLLPGMVTKPIHLKEGWYICKVFDVEKISLDSEIQSKVKKILSERIEEELYQKFYKDFFRGIQVNADRELFDRLVESFYNYLSKVNFEVNDSLKSNISIGEEDINRIESVLQSDLLNPFIKFNPDPVLLKDFLDDLKYGGIIFDSNKLEDIKRILSSRVFNFIQNQLLINKSIEKGYDKLIDVQQDLNIWKDYYLSHLVMKNIYLKSEINDAEALEFYNKENKKVQLPDTVKIAQLTTNDLSIIEKVLGRYNAGENFIELCKEYHIADTEDYISDYFPVTEKGEIGTIAGRLKINEMFGPVKLGNKFILIQLLEKKAGTKQKIEVFNEAKEDIKKILKTKKMFASLDTITSSAAIKSNLKIDFDLLNRIKVTDVNMMVFRRFGFGGQLLAVPYSIPYTSWYQLFLNRLKAELP